ncbi:nucleotidyl transferase AbiEii/AbiGii toxin family protein [Desulfobotulus mexicanus]|uniref:Nucleotidyl transferase AbiEii/AbiGii toxin family protein n=1 Tax=Desulfobotulus mexicanus TaxID=2586642 RepID=A0A5S5MFH5_9BACT|nr:nucleotidyl transferase AbiEii/AbiGii toxin family protein [Desulfobotulus mexicanus]TYT74385.1 nucleotidyl transferase AbiEii/AbiGii toxin family protein [Desulfobotulus mexicanus]
MEVQNDFKELLELFNAHNVQYLIVGGYALAYHGTPRYTGDIDLFVKSDSENASLILKALNDFGFGSAGLKTEDFTNKDNIVQLGYPPVRIDIITSISGVAWEDAYKSREKGKYGDVPVYYIGRDQYIINKRASGRKKDLADIEALGEE